MNIELFEILERAAGSGFLALVLTLCALMHQTREIRRMRDSHEAEEDECERRVDRLQRAIFDLHEWAREIGSRRRPKLPKVPDLSELIGPRAGDDAGPTTH